MNNNNATPDEVEAQRKVKFAAAVDKVRLLRPGGDAAARAAAVAGVLEAARDAFMVADKFFVIEELREHLDICADEVVQLLDLIPLPAIGSPDETRLKGNVMRMLAKIWDGSSDAAQVCQITQACISHFGDRFVGANTFEFNGYIHTSKVLGKGAEGFVHLGFDVANGKHVAIKTVEREILDKIHNGRRVRERLDDGLQFLLKTNHPSIVKVHRVEKLDSRWYIYMEYLDGGDFKKFLWENKDTNLRFAKDNRVILAEQHAKEIFRKIVTACDFLRKENIIHRDLKPANFMLTTAGGLKLVDFSSMKGDIEAGDMTATQFGTPHYMAPELHPQTMMRIKYDGEKIDIFSLGVMLYEMCTGQFPWNGQNLVQIYTNKKTVPLTIPAEFGLSQNLCDLLVNMLKVNPTMRMSWAEVVGHPWLDETDAGGAMEDLIRELQMENTRLNARIETLERGQKLKDATISELAKDLKKQQAAAALAAEKVAEVVSGRSDLDASFAASSAEKDGRIARMTAERDQLQRDNARMTDELHQLHDHVELRGRELAAALESVQQLQKELATAKTALESDAEKGKNALAALQREKDSMQEKVVLSAQTVVQHQAENKKLQDENKALRAQFQAETKKLQEEVNALRGELKAVSSELTPLRQSQAQLTGMDNQRAALQRQLATVTSRVTDLEDELRRVKEERDTVQTLLNEMMLTRSGEYRSEQESNNARFQAYEKDIAQLRQQLANAANRINDLNQQIENLEAIHKELVQ